MQTILAGVGTQHELDIEPALGDIIAVDEYRWIVTGRCIDIDQAVLWIYVTPEIGP